MRVGFLYSLQQQPGAQGRAFLTDNGKVFTGRLGNRFANVLFDRICLNNGIRHILTARYSPTTTGKIERLHKTMRRSFLAAHLRRHHPGAREALDAWIVDYNNKREHQALGDVPPTRARSAGGSRGDRCDVSPEEEPPPRNKVVGRRVDHAERISILKHRYHVDTISPGEAATIESADGLFHISHSGVVVATHARRHLIDDDDKMDRRAQHTRRPNGR